APWQAGKLPPPPSGDSQPTCVHVAWLLSPPHPGPQSHQLHAPPGQPLFALLGPPQTRPSGGVHTSAVAASAGAAASAPPNGASSEPQPAASATAVARPIETARYDRERGVMVVPPRLPGRANLERARLGAVDALGELHQRPVLRRREA